MLVGSLVQINGEYFNGNKMKWETKYHENLSSIPHENHISRLPSGPCHGVTKVDKQKAIVSAKMFELWHMNVAELGPFKGHSCLDENNLVITYVKMYLNLSKWFLRTWWSYAWGKIQWPLYLRNIEVCFKWIFLIRGATIGLICIFVYDWFDIDLLFVLLRKYFRCTLYIVREWRHL